MPRRVRYPTADKIPLRFDLRTCPNVKVGDEIVWNSEGVIYTVEDVQYMRRETRGISHYTIRSISKDGTLHEEVLAVSEKLCCYTPSKNQK